MAESVVDCGLHGRAAVRLSDATGAAEPPSLPAEACGTEQGAPSPERIDCRRDCTITG